MSWPAYDTYKNSGVEWLGELPDHWSVPALGARYAIELGKMLNERRISGRYLLPYLRNVDVQWDDINFDDLPQIDVAPHERERYTVRNGDLLVCEGGEVGRAAIVRDLNAPIAYQKALHRLRPRSANESPRYLLYTLIAAAASGVFAATGNPNTIPHLTGVMLSRFRLPSPPAAEQRVIVRFLDERLSPLDGLLGRMEALVSKLIERRVAIVARATTSGSAHEERDLNSSLVFAGADALSRRDVPKHWRTLSLKRVWRSCDYGVSEPLDGDGPVRVMTMGHIHDGIARPPEMGCLDNVSDLMLLEPGDLLFNRTNSLDHVGKVGIFRGGVDWPVTFASYLVRIRTNHLALPDYLRYVLNTPGLLGFARASALPSINQANLNPTRYGQIRIALPPVAEQGTIVEFLHRETAAIDRLVIRTRAAMDTLREYRLALVTAAVRGAIDVRRFVDLRFTQSANLPESPTHLAAL